jgi:hypothetical protein
VPSLTQNATQQHSIPSLFPLGAAAMAVAAPPPAPPLPPPQFFQVVSSAAARWASVNILQQDAMGQEGMVLAWHGMVAGYVTLGSLSAAATCAVLRAPGVGSKAKDMRLPL